MTVYVGIVTYNSADDLPGCLAALQAQTYPNIQITVLDNASHDHSLEIAQSHSVDVIVNHANVGFARAHNTIIRSLPLTEADYYMPLNPDVTLTPDYIANLRDGLEAYSAGWGTGKLCLVDDDGNHTGLLYSVGHALRRDGYALNIGYHLPDDDTVATQQTIFGAPGAAPLYSMELIRALSRHGCFFDERMFMYGEDVDVDWRAQRHGWQCLYVPSAVGYHRGSDARGDLRTQALGNRMLSTLKNAYIRDLLVYNLPLMLMHLLLRLGLSPRQGLNLMRQVGAGLIPAVRARERPTVKRQDFIRWFAQARQIQTGQPTTLGARLRSFFSKR